MSSTPLRDYRGIPEDKLEYFENVCDALLELARMEDDQDFLAAARLVLRLWEAHYPDPGIQA